MKPNSLNCNIKGVAVADLEMNVLKMLSVVQKLKHLMMALDCWESGVLKVTKYAAMNSRDNSVILR